MSVPELNEAWLKGFASCPPVPALQDEHVAGAAAAVAAVAAGSGSSSGLAVAGALDANAPRSKQPSEQQPSVPSVLIAPGVSLPLISLGTGSGQHSGDVAATTKVWLSVGGRAIDTAHLYQDEKAIGTGIEQSGVPRKDIFVTTKITCGSYKRASAMIDDNLKQLGMSAADLTLIHFDKCWGSGSIDETWRALEDAQASGKTRAIGVSNFGAKDLKALKLKAKTWPPAVNQCSM